MVGEKGMKLLVTETGALRMLKSSWVHLGSSQLKRIGWWRSQNSRGSPIQGLSYQLPIGRITRGLGPQWWSSLLGYLSNRLNNLQDTRYHYLLWSLKASTSS